ncbi:MBL fold metallo-hydrolase [candidate division KSB1 bacterium]
MRKNQSKRRKRLRMFFSIVGITILVMALSMVVFLLFAPQIGAKPEGDRLERIRRSPNYSKGNFLNPVKTGMSISFSGIVNSFIEFLFRNNNKIPDQPLPVVKINKNSLNEPADGKFRIIWLGHSTVLIETGELTLITDPMFSSRPSMFPFAGPKAFKYENPVSIDDLPDIDVVLISHDHYDHLDYETIKYLHPKVEIIITSLGVGAHLEKWGVPSQKIVELDWWEETQFRNVTVTAAPARHFSGRGITDRMDTLWASWIIRNGSNKLFYGGDSGYFSGFEEIGEKYGPFDIAMLECGAYSIYWQYIHMMPEETAQACIDLKSNILMPIHWGKFSLSLHPWTEPVERLLKKAAELNVDVATPVIGESFVPGEILPQRKWWRFQ